MSVTTSTNTVTQSTLQVLTDYDIHHSGTPENTGRPESPNLREDLAATSSNPADWPTNYRGIPPHRPIDHNLDMEQRPAGSNIPEAIFIATMLNGVRLMANVNTLWRATGGRLNSRIFRYNVGGEW